LPPGAKRSFDRQLREIVALILIEGFGYREVSDMLDLPIGTVSSRLVRGRTALLAMVGEP
jgi:RNA polymerase sigma-70 factor (ECF subfamily)